MVHRIIPSEGTVASNHTKGFMGPPSFDKAKFTFNGAATDLRLRMGELESPDGSRFLETNASVRRAPPMTSRARFVAVAMACNTLACVGDDSTTPSDGGLDVAVDQANVIDARNDVFDTGSDATDAAEAGACDLTMPFGTPTAVPGVNSTSNNTARPSLPTS
jgi:hypothetical protein